MCIRDRDNSSEYRRSTKRADRRTPLCDRCRHAAPLSYINRGEIGTRAKLQDWSGQNPSQRTNVSIPFPEDGDRPIRVPNRQSPSVPCTCGENRSFQSSRRGAGSSSDLALFGRRRARALDQDGGINSAQALRMYNGSPFSRPRRKFGSFTIMPGMSMGIAISHPAGATQDEIWCQHAGLDDAHR